MPAQLEVLNGDLNGRHYLIEDDEFLIGRSPSCDLVIPKRYISREHARIVKKGAEYVIDGLSDTNPVTVEDQPASGHRLTDGDEFELCGIRFRWKARGGAVPARHAGVAMSGSAPDRGGSDKKKKDDSWRDEEPDTVPTAMKAQHSRPQRKPSESDDSIGEEPTSARPVKRDGSMTGSTASAPAKKVVFDVDEGKDEADQTAELKTSAKGSVAANSAGSRGSAADAKASGPHGESSNERTAELGKVQDPNDPDYDPFAAVEAKKKKEKQGDPAREKLLRALMIVGSLGIVLAVAIVMKVRQKPEVTTVYVTNPITLALNQALRVDEPFSSSDRPIGPTKTSLNGDPFYIFKGNVCDIEWAVPHVKTKATLIVKAKEQGDSEFVLEYPETARRKVFKVVVDGEDPWDAAREKRRTELRQKSPLELRRLADAHKDSGAKFEKEKEVVRKESYLRLALREYVKAVDAANVLRTNLAKMGTVPPADSERVKVCEESESRARADYEEFVNRVLAQYRGDLQRGATKVELVAQLKRVLRAICNAGDARFIRLRLILEESFQVSYDSDGSELNDEG
jgi:hypothetical protein